MNFILLSLWIGLPAIILLFAIWSKLEQSTVKKHGKRENREPADLFRQFLFVSVCSVISYFIDLWFLGGAEQSPFPDWVPLPLVRLLVYPIVLYIGALVYGGSEPIRITKSPRPTQKN